MDTLAKIALSMTAGLGPTSIRKLVEAYPDDDIFALPLSELKQAFGSHQSIVDAIIGKTAFPRAEQELAFCEKYGIRVLFFTDADYPQRLNRPETQDCPALLYVHGPADLNPERSVAVVGTRRATTHGREDAAMLVQQLVPLSPLIVSGLAYGIDTAAHSASVDNALPTAAVLGHGLDLIYPAQNRRLAADIISHGGALVTEYPTGTAINPRYFPARNRIIAAMADATVVVEASEKGGALITAAIASSYQRDVFAMPGRIGDSYSRGTNNLIATNKAVLLRSADDIAYNLGWPLPIGNTSQQQDLFPSFSPTEQKLLDLLHEHGQLTLEEMVKFSGMPLTKVAATVFSLELNKAIHALPGRFYQATN